MFNIVLFMHPGFVGSVSMARFADMLKRSFVARGYGVQCWAPSDSFYQRFAGGRFGKWAGYVDQYLVFPRHARQLVSMQPDDTLFVFCDQALGPWVPLVSDRPHVVHCNDLLALRSALGEFPENRTRWTGRVYQRLIRRGFRSAKNFISISEKSKEDLHRYGGVQPEVSVVAYIGLNAAYRPVPRDAALASLQRAGWEDSPEGFILHVGADAWYKNRVGVLRLYAAYAAAVADPLPLSLVGPPPSAHQRELVAAMPPKASVVFIQGASDETLAAAYSLARVFVFPSLAEGFGWPIAEALACGCPVVTTDEAPMTEVGGPAAHYLPRMVQGCEGDWANAGAALLHSVIGMAAAERERRCTAGLEWIKQFDGETVIDAYERVYQRVMASGQQAPDSTDMLTSKAD